MRLKQLIIFFFILNSMYSYSQSNKTPMFYLDQNLKKIDTITYSKKCKHITNKCLEYKTDSLIINKVLNKFQFGKFNIENYEQIRLLINRDSKIKIAPKEIIVIKYYDSLTNFSNANKKYLKHVGEYELAIEHSPKLKFTHKHNADKKYLKHMGENELAIEHSSRLKFTHKQNHKFNKKIFTRNREKWLKKQKKCIKKYEKKFPVKIKYIYKEEQNVIKDYKDFDWIKDNGIFKNKFFKIMYNFNLVIIKPNGEYFSNGGYITDKQIKQLIKNPDWSNFKNDLELSAKKYIFSGYGFFKKIPSDHDSKHCF